MRPSSSSPNSSTTVSIQVANVGDRSTTITDLCGVYYASTWDWFFRRKQEMKFNVRKSLIRDHLNLPFVLSSGTRWSHMLPRSENL
jgi:hypothetical protein